MKKRIRRKKHLGEFEKYGILIKFDAAENKMDDVLECMDDFADAHNLYSWGGGYGRISMQHVHNNYDVPTVVAGIMRAIADGECEKPLFCLYSPKSQYVAKDTVTELHSAFANCTYNVSIAPKQIKLWNI